MKNTPVIQGKLIAVEGLDGSGKSTQLTLLKKWLEAKNLKVHYTKWNSSSLVKKATTKAKKRQLLTASTFSLIHATDFADRYENQILPLLQAGYIVLSDRYRYTAYARDSIRGCTSDWVENLYEYAIEPDLTLFFDLPADTALDRIKAGRKKLNYFESGMDLDYSSDIETCFRIFQDKISEEYFKLATKFNFIRVDATQSIEVQQKQVRQLVSDKIKFDAHIKKSEKGRYHGQPVL